MTKDEYHTILVEKLERANSDLPIWPPGIAPGTLRTGVVMDDVSRTTRSPEQEQPIIAELTAIAGEPIAQDFRPRHDRFMQTLKQA